MLDYDTKGCCDQKMTTASPPIVGFIASTWDLMHPGHITALQDVMRCRPDRLIVGLQTAITDRPEKNKPVQTVYERWKQLDAVLRAHRDYRIVPYESEADLLNVLATLPKPFIRFIGADYLGKDFTGKPEFPQECMLSEYINSDDRYWPDVIYLPRDHSWSTSTLRKKIENNPVKSKKPAK